MRWLRKRGIDIGRYLPKFLTKDKEFKAITTSGSLEHDRLLGAIEEQLNELFIDTAIKNLDTWDTLLGINTSDLNVYERRNRIKIELNRNTSSTQAFLEGLCNQYIADKSCYIIPSNHRYFFDVYFSKNECFDMVKLRHWLDLYKPAHLGYQLNEVESVYGGITFSGVVMMDEVIEVPAYVPYSVEPSVFDVVFNGVVTEENVIEI